VAEKMKITAAAKGVLNQIARFDERDAAEILRRAEMLARATGHAAITKDVVEAATLLAGDEFLPCDSTQN